MEEISGERGRAKRQKIDRAGRFSALERLKKLKGQKNKYCVSELENVYDTVDESEYSERVLARQEDDWIEDDGGSGYVEDGREIFDDDEDESTTGANSKDSSRGQKRKAKVAPLATKGNIRNLLGSMPAKKKEEIKTSEDNILSELISDLDSTGPAIIKPKPILINQNKFVDSSKKDAQNYFKSLSSIVTKKPVEQTKNDSVKVELDEVKSEIKPPEALKPEKPKYESKKSWSIDPVLKEESATQQIEEFNSQDFDFDDIDLSNDGINSVETKQDNVKTVDAISDVANEFMDDDEIFTDTSKKEVPKVIEPPQKNSWAEQQGTNETTTGPQIDVSKLPLQTNEDGKKVLKMYWLDAWEDRFVKPGVVYLFGKVYVDPSNKKAGSVSCCVVVKNINRKLYLLPREYKLDPITLEEDKDSPVSILDVYNEFNSTVASELKLKEFRTRKVTKNYAFELTDVPAQSEYLEIQYLATFPPPPSDKKYLTFSHIFGSNTSSLETFLLDRKLKGPCWIEVEAPENVVAKVSWCKLEVNCMSEQIRVLRDEAHIEPPPVVVAAINMRTAINAKTGKSNIVVMSCLVHNQFPIHKPPPNPPFQTHFCIMTRCNDVWPLDLKQALAQFKATKLTKCDTERELLNFFLVQFWKLDADLVVGHDMQGFQQDLLIGNILDLRIPNWSRLGRLKRSVAPQKKFASKDAFLGRLVCDIKLSAMELIRSRSYDLDTLCQSVLKLKEGDRVDIVPDELPRYYENSRDLLQLVTLTMQDASYVLKIMCELNVLPLALQITQIAGNVMSRTLMGGRSERNEFLLLHAFTEKDYIVPDKSQWKKVEEEHEKMEGEESAGTVSKKQVGKKKPAYSGGLVLDPKKGFYDKLILLMDFNSLYPSIIQEYNVCFTTVKKKDVSASDDDIDNLILPSAGSEPGILPTQIRKLVESRREVKKLMKTPDLSPEQYMQYNIRQTALKLTANSMYGCLGFTHSRFYAKPLAALTTMKGREILMDTKEIVQKLNYDVIYGDTDSLMINTNSLEYDQVFKIGNELKKEINKKYRQIELDIDGVFRYLLLLKKKKYAAVIISKNKNGELVYTQEHKGLDIVRRDWSQLAAESGKFILSQILSEQTADDRVESIQTHLAKLREDLANNKMPLSMLTITKQLTKNPTEYADKNGQPHVQVALRMNANNGRRFKKGDIVPYIICEDGTSNPATQRAYHIEELKNSETLKVDINYYLANQLHPVISRICDPIEGMDAARVADCLGLDPAGYRRKVAREPDAEALEIEDESDKYRHCAGFCFLCPNEDCKTENVIKETINKTEREAVLFLEKCQNTACNVRPVDYIACLVNQLTEQLRRYNALYYSGMLVCEDPACPARTRRLPQTFMGGYPLCRLCEKGVMFREYSERDLYLQINYFKYLFDVNKHKTSKMRIPATVTAALLTLKETVEDWLASSAYSIISLGSLFRFFLPRDKGKASAKTEDVDSVTESEQIDAAMEMGTI